MSATVTSFIPGIVAGAQPIRKSDSLTFAFRAAPQAMSVYIRFRELGNSLLSLGAPRLWIIGGTGGVPVPGFYVTYNGGYSLRYLPRSGVTGISLVSASLPAVGQLVELLATLTAGGVAQLTQSINGGALTVASAATASPLPQTWAAQTLGLGTLGQAAIQNFLIVRGVQTMQVMRKYAGVA